MFLEFDFVGGTCYKKYPKFDFWFSKTSWGPRGGSDQKIAYNQKWLGPNFNGGPFWG